MTYGVFIHRSDSIYDDSPAERYQFPAQYRARVEACVGDWIVYYEPSKVRETRGYFAVAKVQAVIRDASVPNMFLAVIEPGTYLDFVNPVPFNQDGALVERGLLNAAGRISGRAQSAVRPLSAADFNRIVSLGLDETVKELPRIDARDDEAGHDGFHEEGQQPFVFEEQRIRIPQLGSRVARDRLFRRLVINAYDKRCAVTGLKLINGGGRAEVDAAHIRPVEQNGPDILTNGIALSGTAHWMFDRGLITLSDDLDILVSRQANDPDSIHALINRTGRAIAPSRAFQRPHPRFLRWHRENCFKH